MILGRSIEALRNVVRFDVMKGNLQLVPERFDDFVKKDARPGIASKRDPG
jgi:hypothetical protein